MFFRRMFSRKSNGTSAPLSSNRHHAILPKSPKKLQRGSSSSDDKRGLSVLQLTPLWEHVIRTRTLPANLNPTEMFDEFLERLRDPEWQVRQHALRVLVDVLIVIGQKADNYISPVIPQLVENLGHPAPTVRKGALDCLRVYISQTAMPETILLEILDIGLNQRITNEPFGGRLTCGVMLSLPSLVQATLHTNKRNYILRSTIDMLVNKMAQVTHQEITLKVLLRIKELIGPREFSEYMTHGAYREFELLCNVYGLENKRYLDNGKGAWTLLNSFESDEAHQETPVWIPSDDGLILDSDNGNNDEFKEKVIMETEIKINDDTLTMRILETDDPAAEDGHGLDNCSADDENEIDDANEVRENTGLIQVLTDSEVEEINENVDIDYAPRTPKRVTFGGEIVKMRTPDSDTVTHSDVDEMSNKSASNNLNKLNFLTVEIPNDNTKPIPLSPRPKSANLTKEIIKPSPATTSSEAPSPTSPKKKSPSEDIRSKLASPKSPFRRISVSPVDDIISPKPQHKEIEILHNLERSPCPSPGNRVRRHSAKVAVMDENDNHDDRKNGETIQESHAVRTTKSWEDLGLVDQGVIKDLKSGDWRHRSHAICSIEEALRSSENLALVQPYLDSLFRTLLSSEKSSDVAEDKRRVVMNLISRLPLDNLENRASQIITGLCRQGGAGSNRVAKVLMQRLPPAVIVLKLLSEDFLHARSSRFRENSLQMVMYALMTFPSTYFDTSTCVTRATYAALDRKKRVRQASLDVLAILGQVTSPRAVMDIVQNIANARGDGNELCTAVKSRLARKQLPIISPDGVVQYALRVPSPQASDPVTLSSLGADIEWIASGIGSVSPTSMKRRAQKFQQSPNATGIYSDPKRNDDMTTRRLKPPHEILALGVGVKQFDDSGNSDDKSNLQYSLATGVPLQISSVKVPNSGGDIIGVHGKRIATKSCSDSSQDGRSSDSTGESIRQTRLPITSRFPAMERLDVTGIYYDRQSFRNPYDHGYSQRFNATYPKPNFSIHQKKNPRSHYTNQDGFTENPFDEPQYTIRNYSTESGGASTSSQNPRRFMNVEKFIMQRKRKSIGVIQENNAVSNGTPIIPITIAPEANKPPQQQQQHSYLIDNVHHHQQDVRQAVEEERKIENHSKTTQQRVTPTSDNSVKLQNYSYSNPQDLGNGNNNFTESSEFSSEDKFSSNHSTPTRVMGEVVTPISIHSSEMRSRPPSNKSFHNQSVPSRPPSNNSNSVMAEAIKSRPPSGFSGKSFMVQDDEVTQIIYDEMGSPVKEPSVAEEQQDIEDNEEKSLNEENEKNEDVPDKVEVITEAPVVEEEKSIDEAQNVEQEMTEQENPIEETPLVSTPKQEPQEIIIEETEELNFEKSPTPSIQPTPPSASPIPTMEVKPITREPSITKSCESIYETNLIRNDIDSKSTASTETSSDYQQSHAASLDDPITSDYIRVKPQHTPLMRKSKTTLFGRNRRVSPVKQSIKLNKTEVFPQNLTRFERPREALNQSISQLDSSNWETVLVGLRSLVRLMRYHPENLDMQMHMICVQLGKSVKNLRSQVARAGCQAAGELFPARSKVLEQECDDLVGSLLHRTADTNRFLRADAARALESMCDNLPPPKVLHLLTTRGAAHQNAMVRTTAAKLLNRLADRLGCDRIFNMNRENRDKFILTGANLLLEGSLETRSYAKALFRTLSDHHSYSRVILEVIPSRTYRNIEKTLKSIR